MDEDKVIGYRFELRYGLNVVYTDDEVFDDREEAKIWGEEMIDQTITEWKYEGQWEDYDNRDNFDVVVYEVFEDEEGDWL